MSNVQESGLKKYIRVTVGKKGMLFFIAYEVITGFLGFLPGIVGYGLRRIFYKPLLHKDTKKPLIGNHVTIRCPQSILLHNGAFVEDHVCLLGSDGGDRDTSIEIGGGSYVRQYAVLNPGSNGFVKIGENSGISHGVQLHGIGGITIGDNVLIGGNTFFVAQSYDLSRADIKITDHKIIAKGINIEDNVWIGANVVIIDGITIKKGAVIGGGSFVNKDVEENCIAVGSPVKVVRKKQ